jgi:hypothetical protein
VGQGDWDEDKAKDGINSFLFLSIFATYKGVDKIGLED